MRISDWSSDVCSSYLDIAAIPALPVPRITVLALADDCFELIDQDHATFDIAMLLANHFARGGHCRGAEKGIRSVTGATQCRRRWRPDRRIGNAGLMPGMSMVRVRCWGRRHRSEEHTSELQSLMRISYAVFCLKKKKTQ